MGGDGWAEEDAVARRRRVWTLEEATTTRPRNERRRPATRAVRGRPSRSVGPTGSAIGPALGFGPWLQRESGRVHACGADELCSHGLSCASRRVRVPSRHKGCVRRRASVLPHRGEPMTHHDLLDPHPLRRTWQLLRTRVALRRHGSVDGETPAAAHRKYYKPPADHAACPSPSRKPLPAISSAHTTTSNPTQRPGTLSRSRGVFAGQQVRRNGVAAAAAQEAGHR